MIGPYRPSFCFFLFTLLIPFLFSCKKEERKILQPVLLEVENLNEIMPITDSLVKPALYHNIGGFDTLSIAQNKEKFIAVILPAILVVKHRINQELNKINDLMSKVEWDVEDSIYYQSQLKRFNANDDADLKIRMETHPTSIVLAQAVVESGWGTSRFFSEANNLFGIWSYNEDLPRIAANSKKKSVYLRKYKDLSGSVMDYFETIARARAYRSFRIMRSKSKDVDDLLPLLKSYSSRGSEYVEQLRKIISQNKFRKYDHHQLDPAYFVEP